MAWYWWAIGIYVFLSVLLLGFIYKNWFWFENAYHAIYEQKKLVAKQILEEKDGKKKRKILRENLFKL
jgi:hypothetical protein